MVAAAVIAGVFMALVSELGFRAGLSRSNLIRIDGEFALRLTAGRAGAGLVYPFGIPIHLITSAVFGAAYYGITEAFDLNVRSAQVIAPYVFVLWIAMLVTALPMAGQGLFGRASGRLAWVEQMAFHAVFGVGFWWALGVV
jgi:hypothetical protein